jgi:hypothetical protein
MTDPVSGKPLAQEFGRTREAELKAKNDVEQFLKEDGIEDNEQEDLFQAIRESAKSLKLYPAIKGNQFETPQEFEAKIRTSLEAEKTSIEGSLDTLNQKKVNLAERIDLLDSLKKGGLSEEQKGSLRTAGFTTEEIGKLSNRGQRIAEQEKLESELIGIDRQEGTNFQERIDQLNDKIEALKTITEAEDEKLEAEGLKPEELQTQKEIKTKLADTKEQQKTLEKVQETLEARKTEVERLQALGNTPEAEGTPGSQDDSNPQAQLQADDGCQGGNCGRQRGRGRAKATIMAVAATELAALQIDYSQFLS